ncbi:MAG: hypothetical protein PW788_03015 [Micavibrio sp.]|nr:hypothetical protein [Micavibrio sp.]
MVRLKGKDNLSDMTGRLKSGFAAITLDHLQGQLIAAQPEGAQGQAITLLNTFFAAADKLESRESVFNTRARKTGGLSLMANLRPPEHFAAIKTFNAAKQDLLGFDDSTGQRIVTLVEDRIAAKTGKAPAIRKLETV